MTDTGREGIGMKSGIEVVAGAGARTGVEALDGEASLEIAANDDESLTAGRGGAARTEGGTTTIATALGNDEKGAKRVRRRSGVQRVRTKTRQIPWRTLLDRHHRPALVVVEL